MQSGGKRKNWDSGRFRRELYVPDHKTFWPKSHPVMFPHLQTDHWSKMKTMVPDYFSSLPSVLLKEAVYDKHKSQLSNIVNLLPPLPGAAEDDPVPSRMQAHSASKATDSPQNMPQYRNVFNDRARRNFCYWLAEKKGLKCKGCTLGSYKTFLGLPKV